MAVITQQEQLKILIDEAKEYLKKEPLKAHENNFSIKQIKDGNRRRLHIDALIVTIENGYKSLKDSTNQKDLDSMEDMVEILENYKHRSNKWTV